MCAWGPQFVDHQYDVLPYELDFLTAAQAAADGVAQALDLELAPRVVLIAVPSGYQVIGGARVIRVGLDGSAPVPGLDALIDFVVGLGGHDEELGPIQTLDPRQMAGWAVNEAGMEGAIRQWAAESLQAHGRTAFAASPVPMEDHVLCLVLGVATDSLLRYGGLPRREALPEHHSYTLVHAAIDAYVDSWHDALISRGENPNRQSVGASGLQLLRHAGHQMMSAAARIVGAPVSGEALFEALEAISSLPYEGGEATGRLVLSRADRIEDESGFSWSNRCR